VVIEIPDDATVSEAKKIVRDVLVEHALKRHQDNVTAAAAQLGMSRWRLHQLIGPRNPERRVEVLRRLEQGATLYRQGKDFVWFDTGERETDNTVRSLRHRGLVRLVSGVATLVASTEPDDRGCHLQAPRLPEASDA
jgi:hypothetical protein